MELEPDHQKSLNQRILKCVGISVVIGLAAGQLFDSADLGNPAARSLTGYGAIADLALIAVAIFIVLGSIQMILVLRRYRARGSNCIHSNLAGQTNPPGCTKLTLNLYDS